MSTEQCRLLLSVYQLVATLPVKAIVLMGGEECWSNGIHLNHIEVAASPADESWLNINAIDDLIHQIITTMDKLTISAVAGSAGAGSAIMALAADRIFAREGVIFNPHYKNMGELYGFEYWTYLLPKRVGQKMATSEPKLLSALEALVEPTTRGDPESALRWTCRSTRQLAAALKRRAIESDIRQWRLCSTI